MQGQTTIFDLLYPKYKITKPIRLIEFFGGYGSQALALKYLGVEFEHWKLCEWAVKSIQAYKDIHFIDDNFDYSQPFNIDTLKRFLYNKGISSNYNEPMTRQQINRLNEKQIRTIYNNIVSTNNLVNIQQVKGKDLEIVRKDIYDYVLTYSFPCQDLSLAGKGKGMSDTSTRSGMLWEVERILSECKELNSLPQILLMENVPQVHGEGNVEDFNKWQLRLEELGYKNYWEDLIATDYGIPQTRNRCFMVSILGDYSYSFPKPIKLELKLKDMLEDNVDEKYFISDKMLNCFLSESKDSKFPRKERFLQTFNATNEKGIAATITTCAGTRATDNFIKEETLKKELCNKLIQDNLVKEYDVIKHAYSKQILDGNKKCVERTDGNMITLTTRGDCVGTCVNDSGNLRIRKLTPRECFRLMGVKDEDFDKVKKNQSDMSLFHLAGDSIVVNVLMAIFKELL